MLPPCNAGMLPVCPSPSPPVPPYPWQAASGMGIYGPRTVLCIAVKGYPGCHEFLLQDDGKWLHVKETTHIGESHTPTPLTKKWGSW